MQINVRCSTSAGEKAKDFLTVRSAAEPRVSNRPDELFFSMVRDGRFAASSP